MPTISTLTVDVVSRTSGFTKGLKVATAGLAALAAGAAYAFGKFEESENVLQSTAAVIESTGGAAHVTAKHVDELATALSKQTAVDDEVIGAGENMLLTFKNIRNEVGAGNDIFDQATTATLDLAAGMASASGGTIDMKASSIQLGKALNDPIAGLASLTRVGIQFTEDQKHQIEQLVKHNNLLGAQKVILAEVTSQFEGRAEAMKTTSAEAGRALEELAETIGGLIAPAVRVLAEQLGAVIAWLQVEAPIAWAAFTEGVMKAWDAVKPFAETIGNVLVPLLLTAWHTIQDRILPAFERIKPLLIIIGAAVLLFATMIVTQLALVVTAVGFVLDKFLDLVGFIRDKVVEPVVNFLGRVVEYLKGPFSAVWENIVAPIGRAIGAIIRFIGGIIAALDSAIDKALDFAESLAHAAVEAGVFKNIDVGGSQFPGFVPPHLASGGSIERSGLAVVHKGETVIPAGVGSGVTVVVNGWVGSDQQIARRVRDELVKLGKRNVTTGI